MNQTLKVSSVNSRHGKRDGFAFQVACQSRKPLGSRMVAMRELQSAAGEELSALLPSVLRPSGGAFKGEL